MWREANRPLRTIRKKKGFLSKDTPFKAEGHKAPRRPRQVLKVAADNG